MIKSPFHIREGNTIAPQKRSLKKGKGYAPAEWVKIKGLTKPGIGEDVEHLISYIAGGCII